jgi:hypothetical protein
LGQEIYKQNVNMTVSNEVVEEYKRDWMLQTPSLHIIIILPKASQDLKPKNKTKKENKKTLHNLL